MSKMIDKLQHLLAVYGGKKDKEQFDVVVTVVLSKTYRVTAATPTQASRKLQRLYFDNSLDFCTNDQDNVLFETYENDGALVKEVAYDYAAQ